LTTKPLVFVQVLCPVKCSDPRPCPNTN